MLLAITVAALSAAPIHIQKVHPQGEGMIGKHAAPPPATPPSTPGTRLTDDRRCQELPPRLSGGKLPRPGGHACSAGRSAARTRLTLRAGHGSTTGSSTPLCAFHNTAQATSAVA